MNVDVDGGDGYSTTSIATNLEATSQVLCAAEQKLKDWTTTSVLAYV